MTEVQRQQRVPEDARASLDTYIGGKPTAIFLFSPGFEKGVNVDFKSSSLLGRDYLRGSYYGYNGGILRVWAVADLYGFYPDDTQVITSSISPVNEDTGLKDPISHAAIQERELGEIWKKRGVTPPATIMKEENSFNTITELAELVMLSIQNNWEGNILGVTNDYHVRRTTKILERLPSLLAATQSEDERYKDFAKYWKAFKEKEQKGTLNIVIKGAESILMLTDNKFKHALENALSQDPWKFALQTREEKEEQGVQAIESETYLSQPLRRRD